MVLAGKCFHPPRPRSAFSPQAGPLLPARSVTDGLRGEAAAAKDASGIRPNESVKKSLPDLESSPRAQGTQRPPAALLGTL